MVEELITLKFECEKCSNTEIIQVSKKYLREDFCPVGWESEHVYGLGWQYYRHICDKCLSKREEDE